MTRIWWIYTVTLRPTTSDAKTHWKYGPPKNILEKYCFLDLLCHTTFPESIFPESSFDTRLIFSKRPVLRMFKLFLMLSLDLCWIQTGSLSFKEKLEIQMKQVSILERRISKLVFIWKSGNLKFSWIWIWNHNGNQKWYLENQILDLLWFHMDPDFSKNGKY